MATNLPPQAYTRDTLVNAYEWLKRQPQGVKELATNADDLVALYLKAKRNISSTPVSQNFKKDLQSIADDMKVFEGEPISVANQTTPPTASLPPVQNNRETKAPVKLQPESEDGLFDEKTRKILEEVTRNLNLSSPEESLRMLIMLGYKKIKQILP